MGGQERAPQESNDEEKQFRLQQGTLCSNGDTCTLATCRSVDIMLFVEMIVGRNCSSAMVE